MTFFTRRNHSIRVNPGLFALFGAVMFLSATCTSADPTPVPPSVTPLVLPATPIAVEFPPTPTAITLPPTPTAITLPPSPTPISDELMSEVMAGIQRSTADIVEELTPAVVAIRVQTPFGDGSGTGVIVNAADGLILTNQHVVDGARAITVALAGDRVFEGKIVGEDYSIDIAVIKVDAIGLQQAVLGDASTLRVGDDVIAIGNALGLAGGPTVSKGVVSALGRTIQQGNEILSDLIQTDAAINPGNSGGPLINTLGEVIGVNTARASEGEGIGFAIEIETAKAVADRLIEESTLPPGFIGFRGLDITPALAQMARLPVARGVGIVEVVDDAAAQKAGIQVDDIIVQLNDTPIIDLTDVSRFLRSHRAGETITIFLWRGNRPFRTALVLEEAPND